MTDRKMAVMAQVAEQASRKAVAEVLDEIFKEIKHMKRFKAESLGVEEHCDYFDAHLVFQEDVLYIIDKYRAESEVQDADSN